MDQELYDEFGNYIGPVLDEDLGGGIDSDGSAGDGEAADTVTRLGPADVVEYDGGTAEESPFKDVEVFIQHEDTQTIEEPIVKSQETRVERVSYIKRLDEDISAKSFDILEERLPRNRFSFRFMTTLMRQPQFIRNVCICGDLHHGKTTVVDRLINYSRFPDPDAAEGFDPSFVRYTDTRLDEQAREMSIKATPISLVFQSEAGTARNKAVKHKSYLFNIFDTPGHVNFIDEFMHAQSLCDGCVFVVDVLVGRTSTLELMLKSAIKNGTGFCVILNCIDRLVLEMKIPPTDAYLKIRHTIADLNEFVKQTSSLTQTDPVVLSPLRGNVLFASSKYGIFFTLESFSAIYAPDADPVRLAKALWGDTFYNPATQEFTPDEVVAGESDGENEGEVQLKHSFVAFVLEPLYKIFSHVASDEREELTPILDQLGVSLRASDYRMDTRKILQKVFAALFSDPSGFVSFVVENVPPPTETGALKLQTLYTGDRGTAICSGIEQCDPDAQLMIFVAKNYYRLDTNAFDVFGRVLSGTVTKGQRIKILGDEYTLDDDEDMQVRSVGSLWIAEGRYRVEVNSVSAGNWVLISGIDLCSHKTMTITSAEDPNGAEVCRLRPTVLASEPVFKVAIEPLNPSELPRMVEGLRRIDRSYPAIKTRVEESGEHVVMGTGELYLDCALHDLRRLYGDLEVKVSDPVVRFTETIMEQSATKCFAETQNQMNKLCFIAEPLEQGISSAIDEGLISPELPDSETSALFMEKYNWDILAARSIWCFGPDNVGPNILLDDVLPSDPVKAAVGTVRSAIMQGFNWACKEGPLVEEPFRNTKFKLIGAEIATDAPMRSAGQIIPATRRAVYGAFLLSTPRLMEPIVFSEIICPADCVASAYSILSRRRGHVLKDVPKPGTPFYEVHAYLPAIESFGFETDLRVHTHGQAFGITFFDHWNIVPGDPLDKSIMLKTLEPAPIPHLAREFMLKTRRRKGLAEDISINKYFDATMLQALGDELEQFY
ncbi:u5 small nuclear ribonuclear protein, putative [Babesia bigemina]|uniref:U5 small nuclear ribonuclear protein, putative n=1 Tax=Babesia bigemina TaxID=5866 RepID=A0A061D3I7_BABBI|nr:u5 small nuclear ribonuclear protein, putative [Babesia bigemina]CDR95281.1 u5 small nuclear ribonuclear protein, putative [Babesia bigemina]|eukprot:XP_012767467.1 u5 small nuclear ribonuclear protein, putative [Babesia bigemina]